MYFITKRLQIAGAHQLALDYNSKCSNLHGHNWIIMVYCKARKLNANGMVVDFNEVKRKIHDRLDHRNLNEVVDFNPTAENIARWVVKQIPECYKCSVQESEGNIAVYVDDNA